MEVNFNEDFDFLMYFFPKRWWYLEKKTLMLLYLVWFFCLMAYQPLQVI